MIRSSALVAALGVSTAVVACFFIGKARQDLNRDSVSTAVQEWPICWGMGSTSEGTAWAPLDPDFAAGKRALAAADWTGAIAAFRSTALRDTRNADVQYYLGYAHLRLLRLEEAIAYFRQALMLNPRHRGARGHLGEAYLVIGDFAKAEEQLAALRRICLIPCDEYGYLERAITIDRNRADSASGG